jgi:hypothetical protein
MKAIDPHNQPQDYEGYLLRDGTKTTDFQVFIKDYERGGATPDQVAAMRMMAAPSNAAWEESVRQRGAR